MTRNRQIMLRWGAAALVAAIALLVWLGSRDGGQGSGADSRFVSKSELFELAKGASPPVYWIGPAVNAEYELREVEGGHQVLYVPAGGHSGAASTRALTIGSYPLADPVGAVEEIASQPDAIVRQSPDGRRVVGSDGDPSSVYFAVPRVGVEVEVYSPSPGRAMRLALSGRVRPVR